MPRIPICLALLLLLAGPAVAQDPPDSDAIKAALETLEKDDRVECKAALEVLAKAEGRKVVQSLGEFGCKTAHRELTLIVGDIICSQGEKVAKGEFSRLLTIYENRSDYLVRVAMMAERLPGDPGIELLAKLARHGNDNVAAKAVRGLGARQAVSERKRLEALTRSNRLPVAVAAAHALSQLPPEKSSIDLLLARTARNSKDRVGDACALALAEMPDAEKYGLMALELLPKKANANSFHAITKLVLRTVKHPEPSQIITLIKSNNPKVREVGCDLAGLAKVDDAALASLIVRLALREKDWRVRVAAWLAVSRIGVDHVVDTIRKTIGTEGENCYWAIQCAGRHPRDELLPALRIAAMDTSDPVRRELAQRALRLQDQRDLTRKFFLAQAKKNKAGSRGAVALLGLGNLKDRESFDLLVGMLGEKESASFQKSILKGLEKLTGHYYEPDPEIWKQWCDVVGGQVAYDPPTVDRKKNRERIRKIRETGISKATEAAVEAGLLWLSRHQDANGGWNGSTFHEHCPRADCRDQGGIRDRPLAYTALALLAFQGAGYTHLDGPYRDIMRRGFEFILTEQDYDGSHLEKSWTFSYEAALVCQALCDAYALTEDEWVGAGAQRAIDYLVKIQHPGETWRYQTRSRETDTSVMSWVLMGCVSGQHAGLHIPDQIYVCCSWWLDRASDPVPPDTYELFDPSHFDPQGTYGIDVSRDRYGRHRRYLMKTWYQPPKLYTPAMPAIGILCRIWMGWTRAHPACIGNANTLMESIPGYGTGLTKEASFYPYTWYYGSLAMYQMGGRYWAKWREKCINDILAHQFTEGHLAGSWKMPREQFFGGLTGGPLYCTAMCILTLETFYRYQPYLARAPMRGSEGGDGDGKKKKEPPDPDGDPKKPDGGDDGGGGGNGGGEGGGDGK